MELADRRRAVMSVLDDAARSANIPRELLGGIWGIESSYGRNLTSPTGCEGDFQFLASTFAGEITNNGGRIAARLRATGHADLATTVEHYQQGLKNGTISKRDAGLQALRDDPYISTYAAAYLTAETARGAHVDPHNRADWGVIYAGYNVGPKAARDLRYDLYNTPNAKDHLGVAAQANPHFFRNGATGAQALQSYQNSVTQHVDNFVKHFEHGVPATTATSTPVKTAPAYSSSSTTQVPVTRQSSGTHPDYFEDVVGKYLGDGQVHRVNGTIVKYGICQSANPDVDVAHLTRDQALQVYRDRYWNNLKGIHEMSREDAAATFDMSYRHGAGYANRHLGATETRTESTAPQSLRTTFQTSSTPPQPESLASKFLHAAAKELRDFFSPTTALPAFSYL